MNQPKRNYDSTVARIAGNIASGFASNLLSHRDPVTAEAIARDSVALARLIVAEVRRTEPAAAEGTAP